LITSSTATTNISGSVALTPGKTWGNDGTVNFTGASTVDLGDSTAAIFNNNAGGIVNIGSSAGWSFISDPGTQVGQINNAGTINVNNNTSWEAAFNNFAGATLNIAAGKYVSMQNGQNIAGAVNIGAGGTLWVSEWHGTDTFFSNTTIGGTVLIINGASVFGALDAAGFGSGFGITNGEFQQASGDLMVPSNASYSGVVRYVAQSGDLIVPGLVNASGFDITLDASSNGSVKVLGGGSVSGASVSLLGNNGIIIGETTSSLPASVQATTLLEIATSGSFKLLGGSGPGAYAAASSNGALTVDASGDVILTGGSGSGTFAHLLGNPDVVLATVGGAVRLDAGSGAGSYAAIESVSPSSVYATFPNLASGGYFVNGVEGAVYDAATGTGFIAGGSPAVLASNLLVTYGLTAPPLPPPVEVLPSGGLEAPNQTLIVATGKSTEAPETENDRDALKKSEDKKKEAPVCK